MPLAACVVRASFVGAAEAAVARSATARSGPMPEMMQVDEEEGVGQAKLEGVAEAPCYYPTPAQFEEPLEYIASIRPDAEQYGICRICPPPGWKPPFAHKPDKLRFATKEQDLVSAHIIRDSHALLACSPL